MNSRQYPHSRTAGGGPGFEVELAEQAHMHAVAVVGAVPGDGEAFEIMRQMNWRSHLVHRLADHVQGADTGRIECIQRSVRVFGTARVVAGVDDGGDAGVERRYRGELRALVHVLWPVGGTQRFGDHRDIGEEVVDVGHHATHHSEPGMMVGIDEAWKNNGISSVYDLGIVGVQALADGDDPAALDEDVAGLEVRDIGIHRHDGAAPEELTGCLLSAHAQVLLGASSGPCSAAVSVIAPKKS